MNLSPELTAILLGVVTFASGFGGVRAGLNGMQARTERLEDGMVAMQQDLTDLKVELAEVKAMQKFAISSAVQA